MDGEWWKWMDIDGKDGVKSRFGKVMNGKDGDGHSAQIRTANYFSFDLRKPCPWCFVQEQEIAFTTESVQSEDGTSGYQSTLDCQFFENGGYLGEVCAGKKAAEHSAARMAIEHEFPDFVEGEETLGIKTMACWKVQRYCSFC